jgi:hypothetical protein
VTIEAVRLAAPAQAWEGCGFALSGSESAVGTVRLRFEPRGGGIAGWVLRGTSLAAASPPDTPLPAPTPRRPTPVAAPTPRGSTIPATDLDGLSTELSEAAAPEPASHPNGALRIDHIVVFTPELGRTSAALEGAGLSLRRIREPDEPGPPARQAFFRLGEVILEVVEAPQVGEGPARFWGLTLCVSDIDACAGLLGDRLGEVRDAVQPGRRIATVRSEAGLGVPVALISEERR